MNRVGHAFIKRRMREEDAVFGGEVTGHYYFRDFYYADNGFIPALLILELMSRKGKTLHELLAPLREQVLHLGRDQHHGRQREHRQGEARGAGCALQGRHTPTRSTASPPSSRTGTSTSAASNTEPLLRLNLEAMTPELMEKKRDEVLAIIRA